ncbi:MAG: sulfatase-like hydrolase/transferase [Candidatus Nanohalobium sp.]
MSEFKNIMIFVSDALNYNYIPDSIAEEGSGPIKTLAPSLHSPQSFTSLLTGFESPNHEVDDFFEFEAGTKTVFDLFPNTTFYDHKDSAIGRIFGQPIEELEDIEEPFIWVERAMETHEPYGVMEHGNELPREYLEGREYFSSMEQDEIIEEYENACDKMEEHFWRHIQTLKNRGIYENTLVIFTSDHGEIMGENIWGKKRFGHNNPPTKHVAQVPTVFLNSEIMSEYMRTVDILPTALSMLEKGYYTMDGVNIKEETVDKGICQTTLRFFKLQWTWNGEDWQLKNPYKGLIEDLMIRTPLSNLVAWLRRFR